MVMYKLRQITFERIINISLGKSAADGKIYADKPNMRGDIQVKIKRRILSMLLAVCLIVGIAPTTAFAANTTATCTHTNKKTVSAQASTCTVQGWNEYQECSDCGKKLDMSGNVIDEKPYLPLAAHAYTAKVKSADYVIRPGNCAFVAQYYYSCSVCGKSEKNLSHFFEGEKNKDSHTNGTRIEGAVEPDHKNQIPGSTGKTICNGCGAVLIDATEIQPDAHVAADVWSSDETYHWKECNVVGCGVQIDGTKAVHSSTDKNVATCQKKAVCDVCGTSYGDLADHSKATEYTSDETGHWYACTTAGCTEKLEFAEHTPDHEGHATEEYPIKCSECQYVMEAQLAHTHKYTQRNTDEKYKDADATCTKPATYYYSCICGEKGTETFELGSSLGHSVGTEWLTDEDYHWHICTAEGCGVVIESSKGEHADTAVKDHKCDTCGKVLSTCTDNDDDHICDICGYDKLGIHADANKDHKCDYGCTTLIGECVDKNLDHHCDYGCDKYFGEHADNDDDHNCDYCGQEISKHSGGTATCNKKAICKVCLEPYGEENPNNHANLKQFPENAATAAEAGNVEYWYCDGCKKYFSDENAESEIKLNDTVIVKLAPSIIKGDGQTVTEGDKKALEFTSDAAFEDFIRVEIDGKTIDESNYTVKSGSTVVTLNADYVSTLSAGEHTLGIVSQSGTATAKFTVNEKVEETKSPKTGDDSNIFLWLALLFVSGGTTAAMFVGRKKRRAE